MSRFDSYGTLTHAATFSQLTATGQPITSADDLVQAIIAQARTPPIDVNGCMFA
jgi:hypothetical protein